MRRSPPTTKGRRVVRINALTQAKLITLMLDGLLTAEALAAETGLHYVTVLNYTRALWREGAAYIDHYELDALGRDGSKVYKIGRGKDAKRHRFTETQKTQRYRNAKRLRQNQSAMTLRPSIEEAHRVLVGSEV